METLPTVGPVIHIHAVYVLSGYIVPLRYCKKSVENMTYKIALFSEQTDSTPSISVLVVVVLHVL